MKTFRRIVEGPFGNVIAVAGLALLVWYVFSDVLFTSTDNVASGRNCDVYHYFAESRAFSFTEMYEGRLPLWNPYLFSGCPNFGNFQSALMYPPNMIYLVLPLAKAVNVDMAGHVLIIGLLMYAWCRARRLSKPASFFSGAILMLSGSYYLHVLAGHLTMLAVLAWAPLVFLAADKILDSGPVFPKPGPSDAHAIQPRFWKNRATPWVVLGAAGLAMQLMGGLPQGAFCTVVAVFFYAMLRMPWQPDRITKLTALASMGILAFFVAAVQLWPNLETAAECTRTRGLPLSSAGSFSFPPENLLMLLAPGLFGDYCNSVYWGRWAIWETGFFIGVTGFFLSIYGAFRGGRESRKDAFLAGVFIVIALGIHTPVFNALYRYFPGFDLFRAPARYMFFATVFMALLAGAGLDALLAAKRPSVYLPGAAFIASVLIGAAGLYIWYGVRPEDGQFRCICDYIYKTGEAFYPYYESVAQTAPRLAAKSLFWSAGTCLLFGLIALGSNGWSKAAYGLILVGVIEVALFAHAVRGTFDLDDVARDKPKNFNQVTIGDTRVLDDPYGCNRVMHLKCRALWGYDPMILRRYTEFMTYTQDRKTIPSAASNELYIRNFLHPFFRLLRLRHILPQRTTNMTLLEMHDPLPRFLLAGRYKVVDGTIAEAADAMEDARFDPLETVLLESEPSPRPVWGVAPGEVTIVAEGTDWVRLHVYTPQPAILLRTESYSNGWRVRGVGKSAHNRYSIMPADYVLQAIPLGEGEHDLVIEYVPRGYTAGRCASFITLAFALGYGAYRLRRRAPIALPVPS